jgi:hypothetical protein
MGRDYLDIHNKITLEGFINLELGKLDKKYGRDFRYKKENDVDTAYDLGCYLTLIRIKEFIIKSNNNA